MASIFPLIVSLDFEIDHQQKLPWQLEIVILGSLSMYNRFRVTCSRVTGVRVTEFAFQCMQSLCIEPAILDEDYTVHFR